MASVYRRRPLRRQAAAASMLVRNFLKRLDQGKLMDRKQRDPDGSARKQVEAPAILKKFGRRR